MSDTNNEASDNRKPDKDFDERIAATIEQYGQLLARHNRAVSNSDKAALQGALGTLWSVISGAGGVDEGTGEFKAQYTEYYDKGLSEG